MVSKMAGSARPQPEPSSPLREPSPLPSPQHRVPRSFSLNLDALPGGSRHSFAAIASFASVPDTPTILDVHHTPLSSTFVLGNLVTNSPLLYADRRSSMPAMAGSNEPWVQPDQMSNRHSFVPPLPDIPAYYSSRNLARPARNRPPRAGYLPRTDSLHSYDNRFPAPSLNSNCNVSAPNGLYRAPGASNSYSTLPRTDSRMYDSRSPAPISTSNLHASASNEFNGQYTAPASCSTLPRTESSVYERCSPVPHSTSSRDLSAPGKIRRKPVANSYVTASTLIANDSQLISTTSASVLSNDLSQITDTSLRTSTPSRMSSTTYKDDQERYTRPNSPVFRRQSGNVADKVRTFSEEFPSFDESMTDFDATSTFHEFRNTRTDLDPLDPIYMEDAVSPGQIERPRDPVGTKAGQQPTKQARRMPSFFGKASTPAPSKATPQGYVSGNKTLRNQSSRFNLKQPSTKPTLKQAQRVSDITDHILDEDPCLKSANPEAIDNLPTGSDVPNPTKTLKNKNKSSPKPSRSMFNIRKKPSVADLVIGDPFNYVHVAGFGTDFHMSTPINREASMPASGQHPVPYSSSSVTATQFNTQASGSNLARSTTSPPVNNQASTLPMTQNSTTTRETSQVSAPLSTNSSTPAQTSGRRSGLRWGKRSTPATAAPGPGAPGLATYNTSQVFGRSSTSQNVKERTSTSKSSTPTTSQAPRPRSKLPFQSRGSAKSSKGIPSKLSITVMDDAVHLAGTGTVFEDTKRQIAADKQAALDRALRESPSIDGQRGGPDVGRSSPRQYTSRQDSLGARHVMTPTQIPSPVSERPDSREIITPVLSFKKKENNPPAKEHRLLGQISPARVQEQPTGLPLPKSKTLASFSNFGRSMVNLTTRNQAAATLHAEPTTSVSETSATAAPAAEVVPVVPDTLATAPQAVSGNNFRMFYEALPMVTWAGAFSSLNDRFQTEHSGSLLRDSDALRHYQSREESTRRRNRSDNPFSDQDEIDVHNVGIDNLHTEEHRRWKRIFILLESRCIGDEAKESLWDFQEFWANKYNVPNLMPKRDKKEDEGFMSKFKNVFGKTT